MMSNQKNIFHIGTSGWNYPHWKGLFYPDDLSQTKWLQFYASKFSTVELNSTFYHLPKEKTYENWKNKVSKNFIFSVKASRFITHIKKLNNVEENLKIFLDGVKLLKEKLGPILFQLPPNFKYDLERLNNFINFLPKKYFYTFEFRDKSWWNDEIYTLLKKNNCAFCIFELDELLSPKEITTDFIYVRLHGHKKRYGGDYGLELLNQWAEFFIKQMNSNKNIYCYFDNDENAYAIKNAGELITILSK
ncbi:MAG: DUF72 domain-containing protein [Ignavibacterium sp.]